MVKLFFLLRRGINEKRLKIFFPLYRLIGLLYSSAIPLSCHIGKNMTFMHGLYGIFISGGAELGDNITLYQHVTIGGNWDKNSKTFGAPTIGDNTIIYPGAKIIGGVTIGKHCKIGPNVVIWEDIEDYTTVIFDKSSFRKVLNNA